jgi:hypothetical protein
LKGEEDIEFRPLNLEETWKEFKTINKNLFAGFTCDPDQEEAPTQVDCNVLQTSSNVLDFEDCFVTVSSHIKAPNFSNSARGQVKDWFIRYFRNHLNRKMEEFERELVEAFEMEFTEEQNRCLLEILNSRDEEILFDFGYGYLSGAGMKGLWESRYLDDELIDAALMLETKREGSKTFSIPASYLQPRKSTRLYKPPSVPSLSSLSVITAGFLFPGEPKHWGLLGYDVMKQNFFYGESFNDPNYQLCETKFTFFVKACENYFPQLPFRSHDFQRVEKRRLPRQTDNWSCGLHIILWNESLSNNKVLPASFNSQALIRSKINFVQKIVSEKQFLANCLIPTAE